MINEDLLVYRGDLHKWQLLDANGNYHDYQNKSHKSN